MAKQTAPKLAISLARRLAEEPLETSKVIGGFLALATFVFGVFQFYDANSEKRKERAASQVERFQAFAASDFAKTIRAQSTNIDGRTYDLQKFGSPSTEQYRALLNFFNLAEGIAYLYNAGVVDPDFIEANLLCAFAKQYRTFVLAQTGHHGIVTPLNNGGVFYVGQFENYDKLHRNWSSRTFNGAPIENRCASQWKG